MARPFRMTCWVEFIIKSARCQLCETATLWIWDRLFVASEAQEVIFAMKFKDTQRGISKFILPELKTKK